jgi:hypothetical protein
LADSSHDRSLRPDAHRVVARGGSSIVVEASGSGAWPGTPLDIWNADAGVQLGASAPPARTAGALPTGDCSGLGTCSRQGTTDVRRLRSVKVNDNVRCRAHMAISHMIKGARGLSSRVNPPPIDQQRHAAAWFLICCENAPHF